MEADKSKSTGELCITPPHGRTAAGQQGMKVHVQKGTDLFEPIL